MNYVTELLEEQKELLTEEMRFAEGEELEQTKQRMTDVVDALNKLSIHGVVKSLPSKGFISQLAEKRALKFNYVNEIGYLRHKKSFELGAEFVKEHLEKQK